MGTKTPYYEFWMPEIDGDEGNWGSMLNANWASLDTKLKTLTGKSKSITIESPTASEDITLFYCEVAITVSKLKAILVGSASPSVTWTIRHDTSRSAVGSEVKTGGTVTTSTTTGSEETTLDDPTIPASSYIWVETTAQSGTVDTLAITLFYDED